MSCPKLKEGKMIKKNMYYSFIKLIKKENILDGSQTVKS